MHLMTATEHLSAKALSYKCSVRHGPSNYAALAANGDILEVAATPSYGAGEVLDWGAGSVVSGKWQRWTKRNKTNSELMVEVRATRDGLLARN